MFRGVLFLFDFHFGTVVEFRKGRDGHGFVRPDARKNVHAVADLAAYVHTAATGNAIALDDIHEALGSADLLLDGHVGHHDAPPYAPC